MAPKKDAKSSESEGRVVAKWDDVKTEIFLKVCIEEIDAGNRPSSHFTKEGWKNITEKFQERTRYAYDRTQLKNRWDALKSDFSSFAKLVEKQTGLGWDHDKQTIQSDVDWWTAKSKEDPEILKWKNGGPKFLDLIEKCFKGTVSTGFVILKPYQDPPPFEGLDAHFEDVEGRENNPIAEDEGEEDSFETNPTPSSSNINLKKWKNERKLGAAEKLQRSLEHIIDGMDQSSNSTVIGPKPEDSTSYAKCLTMLDAVPGVTQGSHLYFKSVRILANKENRIAFFHFMNTNPEMTHDWLSTFTQEDYPRGRR